jgi:hypothetical protein
MKLFSRPIIESGQTNESANTPAVSASSGWGWGSWGAVLNQATNTMTSGLSQVIEKVETTLGIPEPGELQDEAFPKDEKSEVITMEPKPSEIDRGVDGSNNSIGKSLDKFRKHDVASKTKWCGISRHGHSTFSLRP